MDENLVFVLGAGFTRALVPDAPLLVDDYRLGGVVERFKEFRHASAVLNRAIDGTNGHVDIERLMTRLAGMPYDSDAARQELKLLEFELRKSLVVRLNDAKAAGVERDRLGAFARFVVQNKASVITFNYDDVLDEALWDVKRDVLLPQVEHWHPDGGYGFFCRPSSACVFDESVFMDRPSTLLLKLHGSVNWYRRLGEGTPLGPSAVIHHEPWLPRNYRWPVQYEDKDIESHLEPGPFLVPPVLMKAELDLHPVLRVVWARARDQLLGATKIVFVGYSLPTTDLAARTLFQEAVAHRSVDVQVVGYTPHGGRDEELVRRYRSVMSNIEDKCFDFGGALPRIEREFSVASAGEGSANT